jgi:hypothetical protein
MFRAPSFRAQDADEAAPRKDATMTETASCTRVRVSELVWTDCLCPASMGPRAKNTQS